MKPADAKLLRDAALGHVKPMLEALLSDDTVLSVLCRGYMEEQVSLGHYIPREDLTLAGGLEIVPVGLLAQARAELDELRVTVAEHLDGGGRETRLRELIEGPTALDLDPAPAKSPVKTPAKPKGPTKKAAPKQEPDPSPEPEATDDDRRPAAMPPDGTPCEVCGAPVPGPGDYPDQVAIAWTRWRAVLCKTHHKERGVQDKTRRG